MLPKTENPWDVESIYTMQYYVCPSCTYKHISKQNFICHAFDAHPEESVDYLKNIKDGSLSDILCPWDSNHYKNEIAIVDDDIKPELDVNEYLHEFEDEMDHKSYKIAEISKSPNVSIDFEIPAIEEDAKFESIDPLKLPKEELLKKKYEKTNKFHKCDSCDKSFSKADLKEHINTVHINEVKKGTQCDKCGISYSRAKSLKEHNRIVHEGIKNHKCTECGKLFGYSSSLKKHMAYCHGFKESTKCCDQCGKCFYKNGELQIHIKLVHEGRKDHKCDSCGKFFISKQAVRKHIHTIHEGHKDYCCESCGKSFSTAFSLKIHMSAVHEGRKDYDCSSCAKSFGRKKTLDRHVDTVHKGIKKYKCSFCNTAYGQSGDLNRHIKRCHSQEKQHKI